MFIPSLIADVMVLMDFKDYIFLCYFEFWRVAAKFSTVVSYSDIKSVAALIHASINVFES